MPVRSVDGLAAVDAVAATDRNFRIVRRRPARLNLGPSDTLPREGADAGSGALALHEAMGPTLTSMPLTGISTGTAAVAVIAETKDPVNRSVPPVEAVQTDQ